jgi:uncharacterized membrane protein required for colicin V production
MPAGVPRDAEQALNPVDVIFALLIFLALVRGYSKGLLGTVAGYVAPVIAFMLAADWSDPVRDRIYAAVPMPDFALDILAPLVVFVVVVTIIRLSVAFFARLLGVGLSMPSRLLASLAGATATGLVLGSLVLLVHQMRPEPTILPGEDPEAGEIIAGPFEKLILDLDNRLSGSMLGPPLAEFASAIVSEAVALDAASPLPNREAIEAAARNAAAAAATSVGKMPVGAAPVKQSPTKHSGTAK